MLGLTTHHGLLQLARRKSDEARHEGRSEGGAQWSDDDDFDDKDSDNEDSCDEESRGQ